MRILLTILMLASLAGGAAAQVWTAHSVGGSTADILAIEHTSFSDLWLSGRGGLVAHSDPAREVWTIENVGSAADFPSVMRSNSVNTWVGAGSGQVRRFNGVDWNIRNLPVGNQEFSLFSRGSGTAMAVGSGGDIYKTVNSGIDWDFSYNAGVPLHDGKGFVTGRSWVVGDQGTILKTEDGGANWSHLNSGTTADLHAFMEGGYSAYFAVGAEGTILKSTDAGATWSPRDSGTWQTLRDIDYSGQASGWIIVVGDAGTVLKTTDNGENWCRLSPGTNENLNAVNAITNSEYIVGGDDGTLLRTTDGGGDCIAVAADLPTQENSDLRIYPNPLRGEARASFHSQRGGAYELALYDLAGRRITTIERGRLAAGDEGTAIVKSRDLPAGVYFLQFHLGEDRITRRITILR